MDKLPAKMFAALAAGLVTFAWASSFDLASGANSVVCAASAQDVSGSAKTIADVDKLPSNVTDVSAASQQFDDGCLKAVLKRKSVVKLSLTDCAITDAGMKELAGGGGLENLTISACMKITEAGFAHLASLKALQELSLEKCAVTDANLAAIAKLGGIKAFSAKGCDLLTGECQASIGKMKALETLFLNLSFTVTGDGFAQVGGADKLKSLDLWRMTIEPDVFARAGALKQLDSLRCYYVQGCTAQTMERIASFKKLTSLTFAACGIDDAMLEKLKAPGGLEDLNLDENDAVTGSGLSAVASMSKLKSCSLSFCKCLTDEALTHIGKVKGLEMLYLSECPALTDAGIANVAKLKALKQLNIDRCGKLTDACLKHIEGLKALESLDITGNPKITAKGIEALQNKLPDCEFVE